ncbi:hypothetical protein BASA81_008285 [Batrachochytrium salamandrivorans]|nr:hypothetical protein BASA81_008285 [Batrachochytrium salamandrivorans]
MKPSSSTMTAKRRSTLDEKKDRRPELLNSVPRYFQFDNDRLVSQAYSALLKAQTSWLSAPEILTLLEFSKECGLCAQTPDRPPSGSVFYYDSRSGVCFRRDGYSYIKKKGSAISVREDHVKLRIGNVAVIYASYVHSAEHHAPAPAPSPGTNATAGEQISLFHRRSYWLVNSLEKERGVIVHYLSSGEGSAQIDPSLPHNSETCECMLCSLRRVSVPQEREDKTLDRILERCPQPLPLQPLPVAPAAVTIAPQKKRGDDEVVAMEEEDEGALLHTPMLQSSNPPQLPTSTGSGLIDVFSLDDEFDPYDPDDLLLQDHQSPTAHHPIKQEVIMPVYHPPSIPPPPQPQVRPSQLPLPPFSMMQPFKPPPQQFRPSSASPSLPPLPLHSQPPSQIQSQQQPSKKTDKPQVRFDPSNLLIVEFAPTVVRSCGDKVLINIGMARYPESLNYRTWVEKVVPKLSITVGKVPVLQIDSVSLGVVRFHCPLPAVSSELSVSFDLGGSRGFLALDFAAHLTPMRFELGKQTVATVMEQVGEEEVVMMGEEGDMDLDHKATVMVKRVVQELLKNHASPEVLDEPSPENGFNFLHTVVFCSASLDVVELLLKHGANVNLKTSCPLGNTALHFAVENNAVDCVQLLMAYGADCHMVNNQGLCPMELAETGQMMQLFYKSPSSSNSPGKRQRSASVSGGNGTYAGATHMQMLRHSLGALSVSDQATLAMAVDHRKSSCHDFEEYLDESSVHLPETAPEMDVDQLVTEAQPKIYEMMRNTMNQHELTTINSEAIKIQSNVRAWILRKKFAETQDAATKIQALAKGHLARKDFRDLKDKVTHTLVIQKCFRRHREAQRQLLLQQRSTPQLGPVVAPAVATVPVVANVPVAANGEAMEDHDSLMPPELFLSLD